ncbi:hypothetical protein HPB49_017077 [Dermacentor silvarum]|uniref:Uncharacterized protein n=1 Tax=Dermacentor silvarum TaxID=543639 RepID=A0ACB8CM39_DERSI|nr:hypothetical protein HPB49_017077 [Dermacentor silvarum]
MELFAAGEQPAGLARVVAARSETGSPPLHALLSMSPKVSPRCAEPDVEKPASAGDPLRCVFLCILERRPLLFAQSVSFPRRWLRRFCQAPSQREPHRGRNADRHRPVALAGVAAPPPSFFRRTWTSALRGEPRVCIMAPHRRSLPARVTPQRPTAQGACCPTGLWLACRAGQCVRLRRLAVHARFRRHNYTHDVALAELVQPLPEPAAPICLPLSSGGSAAVGRRCVITGWGARRPLVSRAPQLHQAALPVLPWDLCRRAYPWAAALRRWLLCAGLWKGGRGPCHAAVVLADQPCSCAWPRTAVGYETQPSACSTETKPRHVTETIGRKMHSTTATSTPPTDALASWGSWSAWTDCSRSCSLGVQTRTRHCLFPSGGQADSRLCAGGQDRERRVCDFGRACPVDGGWGPWGPWRCARRCGRSPGKRARRCDNPAPRWGGRPCQGPQWDAGLCRLAPCVDDLAGGELIVGSRVGAVSTH